MAHDRLIVDRDDDAVVVTVAALRRRVALVIIPAARAIELRPVVETLTALLIKRLELLLLLTRLAGADLRIRIGTRWRQRRTGLLRRQRTSVRTVASGTTLRATLSTTTLRTRLHRLLGTIENGCAIFNRQDELLAGLGGRGILRQFLGALDLLWRHRRRRRLLNRSGLLGSIRLSSTRLGTGGGYAILLTGRLSRRLARHLTLGLSRDRISARPGACPCG